MPNNPDGIINIKCSDCGEVICKQQYAGFSTALCVKCQHNREVLEAELKKIKEAKKKK